MKIAFHVSQFTFRGTEVATFDYALYNRHLLKNFSVIVTPKEIKNLDQRAFDKFKKYFSIIFYTDLNDLENICIEQKIDAVYFIKYGKNDNLFLKNIPCFIHCVFSTEEPHGTVYAAVSDSVSRKNQNNIIYPKVEHIVYLPEIKTDLRFELKIPDSATVFGRHGGSDTFNIPFVRNAIVKILNEKKDVWFIFCVQPIILLDFYHERVIYLDSFVDLFSKRKFINTCDAMIHASGLGESFGLSVLEFAYCGKQVITWNGGEWHKQHLLNLGDHKVLYNNENELVEILRKKPEKKDKLDIFTPEKIMKQFQTVFLDRLKFNCITHNW